MHQPIEIECPTPGCNNKITVKPNRSDKPYIWCDECGASTNYRKDGAWEYFEELAADTNEIGSHNYKFAYYSPNRPLIPNFSSEITDKTDFKENEFKVSKGYEIDGKKNKKVIYTEEPIPSDLFEGWELAVYDRDMENEYNLDDFADDVGLDEDEMVEKIIELDDSEVYTSLRNKLKENGLLNEYDVDELLDDLIEEAEELEEELSQGTGEAEESQEEVLSKTSSSNPKM